MKEMITSVFSGTTGLSKQLSKLTITEFMRLLSKSALAFTFSAERFFKENKRVYFWTFTFVSTPLTDEMAMEDWNVFHTRLKHLIGGIKGLRVCELHRSHGIHFHVFLNKRVSIKRMKEIFRGTGNINGYNRYLDFGRLSVSVCNPQTVGYLTKYLTKSYRKQYGFGHRRRWGTIGGFKAVRVRDITYETPELKNREYLFGTSQCSYSTLLMIRHYTCIWGHVNEWPLEHQALVRRQRMANGGEWMRHRHQNEPF